MIVPLFVGLILVELPNVCMYACITFRFFLKTKSMSLKEKFYDGSAFGLELQY